MNPTRIRLTLFSATLLLGIAYAAGQWTMQPKQSTLRFMGMQAAAPFEGGFEKFTADIRFDPHDLAAGRFDVTIDTASVDTSDSERDDLLRGPDLFASKQWPKAHYVADRFTDQGAGKYEATGKLTLRDVTRSVPIAFTFESKDGTGWLKGRATIKRLDFGVGQGEWRDTETVADDVQILFSLRLTP